MLVAAMAVLALAVAALVYLGYAVERQYRRSAWVEINDQREARGDRSPPFFESHAYRVLVAAGPARRARSRIPSPLGDVGDEDLIEWSPESGLDHTAGNPATSGIITTALARRANKIAFAMVRDQTLYDLAAWHSPND